MLNVTVGHVSVCGPHQGLFKIFWDPPQTKSSQLCWNLSQPAIITLFSVGYMLSLLFFVFFTTSVGKFGKLAQLRSADLDVICSCSHCIHVCTDNCHWIACTLKKVWIDVDSQGSSKEHPFPKQLCVCMSTVSACSSLSELWLREDCDFSCKLQRSGTVMC